MTTTTSSSSRVKPRGATKRQVHRLEHAGSIRCARPTPKRAYGCARVATTFCFGSAAEILTGLTVCVPWPARDR